MSFDAANIIAGPAILTFNGATIYVEEDITVKVTKSLKTRKVANFGEVDDKLLDVIVEITFKPAQWKNLSLLFPYANTAIGARIFGTTDKNCVIQTLDGKTYTWSRCAITKMPNLGLGVGKDLLGEMTITGLKANATAAYAANSIVAIASNAFADTTFDPTTLLDQPYALSWGLTPFNAIDTEDGIDVEFEIKTQDIRVDSAGLVDKMFMGVNCTARFTPIGLTEANFLTFLTTQGTGVSRGASMAGLGNDLIATGTGAVVTIYNATPPKEGTFRFSPSKQRLGQVSLVGRRKFTTGAPSAFFAVATS